MENFKFDPAQSQCHCARSGQAKGIYAHPYAALPKTRHNATKRRLEIIKPKPHFTLCQICSITMCSVYYFQGGICILHPLSTSTALKSRTQIGPSGGNQKKQQARVANSTVPLIRSIKTAYSTCKDLAQFLPPTYCSAAGATTTTPPNSAHLRPCETYQRDGEIHALKWI